MFHIFEVRVVYVTRNSHMVATTWSYRTQTGEQAILLAMAELTHWGSELESMEVQMVR